MIFLTRSRFQRPAAGAVLTGLALIAVLCLPQSVAALDGTNPNQLNPLVGWQAFEIMTQLDDISGVADPVYGSVATRGTYDGIGAYRADGSLALTLNHEITNGAAITGVTVNLAQFQQAIRSIVDGGTTPFPDSFVQRVGFAYETIFDGTYDAVTNPDPAAAGAFEVRAYGNANFSRFCSGTTHKANTFGLHRGFADPLYLTGEEVSGGRFYALDVLTNTLWEASDLGLGAWENAAQIDTGNTTHAALLLNADVSSGPGEYLRLYVGEKNVDANQDGQIDFLERNGMRGGTVHYFAPDEGFSLTDLPDGAVTGTWQTSTVGALRETKLEDVHTNPLDGSQLAFADQTDGVYILESDLVFDASGLDTSATTVNIFQVDDDDTPPLGAPDNLVWSENGRLYVQEDGDGNGIFEISLNSPGLAQIATAFSEPSGIVDVSRQVGYEPGSVLLSSIQGNGNANAQLSVLISPTATRARPGDFNSDQSYGCEDVDALVAAIVAGTHDPDFDITQDGFVDNHDLTAWLAEAGGENLASAASYLAGDANLDGVVDGQDFIAWNLHKFTGTASWCSGDFNADGFVDGQDFVIWNGNKFTSADVAQVPEPLGAVWLGGLVLLAYRRFASRLR